MMVNEVWELQISSLYTLEGMKWLRRKARNINIGSKEGELEARIWIEMLKKSLKENPTFVAVSSSNITPPDGYANEPPNIAILRKDNDKQLVLVNPKVEKAWDFCLGGGGCGSIKGVEVQIPMPYKLVAQAYMLEGNSFKKRRLFFFGNICDIAKDCEIERHVGYLTPSAYHEMEHLEGRLIIDRGIVTFLRVNENKNIYLQNRCRTIEQDGVYYAVPIVGDEYLFLTLKQNSAGTLEWTFHGSKCEHYKPKNRDITLKIPYSEKILGEIIKHICSKQDTDSGYESPLNLPVNLCGCLNSRSI